MNTNKFTHIDEEGGINMVDVSGKEVSERKAKAAGKIFMKKATLSRVESDSINKGPVLETARLAGILAAKKTAELIPLCHQLPLSNISLEFKFGQQDCIEIYCTAKTSAQTGVEMEVLQAVSSAALTIYDMCKAVDKKMTIGEIKLLKKTGGQSGDFFRSEKNKAGEVVTVAISEEKGTTKKVVPEIELAPDHGVIGDAHAGDWHRQVSLLAEESIFYMKEEMKEEDITLGYGDFAENIATRGLILHELEPGQGLRMGEDVLIEVTQIGKECHSGCEIAQQVGNCIMPKEGIFARVIEGGKIYSGDAIYFEEVKSENGGTDHK